jgi:hypothetical protein
MINVIEHHLDDLVEFTNYIVRSFTKGADS